MIWWGFGHHFSLFLGPLTRVSKTGKADSRSLESLRLLHWLCSCCNFLVPLIDKKSSHICLQKRLHKLGNHQLMIFTVFSPFLYWDCGRRSAADATGKQREEWDLTTGTRKEVLWGCFIHLWLVSLSSKILQSVIPWGSRFSVWGPPQAVWQSSYLFHPKKLMVKRCIDVREHGPH